MTILKFIEQHLVPATQRTVRDLVHREGLDEKASLEAQVEFKRRIR